MGKIYSPRGFLSGFQDAYWSATKYLEFLLPWGYDTSLHVSISSLDSIPIWCPALGHLQGSDLEFCPHVCDTLHCNGLTVDEAVGMAFLCHLPCTLFQSEHCLPVTHMENTLSFEKEVVKVTCCNWRLFKMYCHYLYSTTRPPPHLLQILLDLL